MRFDLENWRKLLLALQRSGVPILGVDRFLSAVDSNTIPAVCVILRHDVDRLAWRARQMAEVEADVGVSSTYYFRSSRRGLFDAAVIRRVAQLGHEIGYHYESLSRHNGNQLIALDRFERELDVLRTIAPCRTVAMHGAPLSRHDNQKLLEGIELSRYGLSGDAVAHVRPFDPIYVTDTGGGWGTTGHANRRDHLGHSVSWSSPVAPTPTPEFAHSVAALRRPLYINTHPERWPKSRLGVWQSRATDWSANLIKRIAVTLGG